MNYEEQNLRTAAQDLVKKICTKFEPNVKENKLAENCRKCVAYDVCLALAMYD